MRRIVTDQPPCSVAPSKRGHGAAASGTVASLLRLIPSARRAVIVAAGIGVPATALLVVQMLLLSWVVRNVLFRHATLTALMPLLGLAAASAVGRATLTAAREFVSKRAAITVKRELRVLLATHLMKLGPGHIAAEETGDLVATATDGIEKLDAYVGRYLPQTILAIATPLLIALAILPVDLLSTILLVLTVPVIIVLMILIGTFTRDHVQHQWDTLEHLSIAFLDIIQGLPTLLLFNQGESERHRAEHLSERFRDRTLSVLKVAFLSSAVLELMTAAGIGLIATVLGVRLLGGGIPFDHAFFIFLLTPEFYRPLRELGAHRHAALGGAAAAERIHEILATPTVEDRASRMPEPTTRRESTAATRPFPVVCLSGGSAQTGSQSPVLTPIHPPPTIELDDLSYIYPGRAQPALSHLSLSFPAGTCTAVVGRSGSGKSTLLNLLLGAVAPSSGVIRANNVPLGAVSLEAWREHIALVPQHPYLFRGTVRDNIRLACPGAADTEVLHAAELAGCLPFIVSLPDGLDTVIGEQGDGLSAGQRQRLAIARAFLKRAPLLLLDEPTSALDPESEVQLRQALSRLMQDRTVLVVAHRFNTVQAAQRVAVLEAGRLVEYGRHDELELHAGVYAGLMGDRRPRVVVVA